MYDTSVTYCGLVLLFACCILHTLLFYCLARRVVRSIEYRKLAGIYYCRCIDISIIKHCLGAARRCSTAVVSVVVSIHISKKKLSSQFYLNLRCPPWPASCLLPVRRSLTNRRLQSLCASSQGVDTPRPPAPAKLKLNNAQSDCACLRLLRAFAARAPAPALLPPTAKRTPPTRDAARAHACARRALPWALLGGACAAICNDPA
jgi:hypothetical protein